MEQRSKVTRDEEMTDLDILFMGTNGEMQLTLREADTIEPTEDGSALLITRNSVSPSEQVVLYMANVLYLRKRLRTIKVPIEGGVEAIAPTGRNRDLGD